SVMDGFFAATALVHGLTLVTRNGKDFAATGTPLFNPWTDGDDAG
ncbi:MAG: VapC toxin family PIN domain ribonuclease, partial [Bradyrhizobium sp.]|nr:VapC toxin family PIN domain ribonuclease [Bradyrhizobium sp.]